MTFIDFLVVAPVLPFLPIIITWWLPWENWIPWAKVLHIIGPVLMYGAFVAWYFGGDTQDVFVIALAGAGLSFYGVVMLLKNPNAKSHDNSAAP